MFLAWFLPAFAGQPAATILSQVKVVKIKGGISKHFTIKKQEENAILRKKSSKNALKCDFLEFLFTGQQKVASLTIINTGARKGVSVLSKAITFKLQCYLKTVTKSMYKSNNFKRKKFETFQTISASED